MRANFGWPTILESTQQLLCAVAFIASYRSTRAHRQAGHGHPVSLSFGFRETTVVLAGTSSTPVGRATCSIGSAVPRLLPSPRVLLRELLSSAAATPRPPPFPPPAPSPS